jgi:putative transposase
LVYHVINRASARAAIFRKEADYTAFEWTLAAAHARIATRIRTYVLMPNHFHLVLWRGGAWGDSFGVHALAAGFV